MRYAHAGIDGEDFEFSWGWKIWGEREGPSRLGECEIEI